MAVNEKDSSFPEGLGWANISSMYSIFAFPSLWLFLEDGFVYFHPYLCSNRINWSCHPNRARYVATNGSPPTTAYDLTSCMHASHKMQQSSDDAHI